MEKEKGWGGGGGVGRRRRGRGGGLMIHVIMQRKTIKFETWQFKSG
jgi:hypothetical protein